MNKLKELIESAYCWEGGARTMIVETSPTTLKVAVIGSSTVEHSGDVAGIGQQVHGLKGQTIFEDGFKFTITAAKVRCIECERDNDEDEDGDGDYEVSVSGEVEVTKEAIPAHFSNTR